MVLRRHRRRAVPALAACALAVVRAASYSDSAPPPTISVTFDTVTPLRTDLTPEYVSVNIDSSSIGKGFDFADPVLNNLVKALGPVLLRLGGTASNSLVWVPDGGLPCGSGHGGGVKLSEACFDTILAFLRYTGARLLFDFSAVRAPGGAWDASNASALMAYAAASGIGAHWGAVQLGNENPGITNGSQMGADFLTARALARAHGLPDAIIGPSAGGTPLEWFQGFCE